MNQFDKIVEATSFLQQYNGAKATSAVVLGSGLGDFVQELQVDTEIEYKDIPHFPMCVRRSTLFGRYFRLTN